MQNLMGNLLNLQNENILFRIEDIREYLTT